MKSLVLVQLMTIASMFGDVTSSCPAIRRITFQPAPGKNCSDIPGAWQSEGEYFGFGRKWCRYDTCADLKSYSNDDCWYCGIGSCNWLGNNCGGCVQLDDWGRETAEEYAKMYKGDPIPLIELFKAKFSDYVDLKDDVYVVSKHKFLSTHSEYAIPSDEPLY